MVTFHDITNKLLRPPVIGCIMGLMFSRPRIKKLFFTYIILSFLTIVIAAAAYWLSYVTIRHAALESGRKDLRIIRQLTEARLDGLYNTVAHLSANPDLNQIGRFEKDLTSKDYYSIITFRNLLPQFNITNTLIEDVYIYFFEPEILLSTVTASVRLPFYYDNFLKHGSLSFHEWDRWIRQRDFNHALLPGMVITVENRLTRKILFFQSFPLGAIRRQGVIMVHIPEDHFSSYLRSINVGDKGFVSIMDDLNRVITMIGNTETFNAYGSQKELKGNFTILSARSETYGLDFVAAIPDRLYYEQANGIRNVMLMIAGLQMAVAIGLGVYFTQRNMAPLRKLIDSASGVIEDLPPGARDEFELIAVSIKSLLKKNTLLSRTVDKQAPLLSAAFIEQWLSGKFTDREELFLAAEMGGVKFRNPCFLVCLVSVREITSIPSLGRRLSTQPILSALIGDLWKENVRYPSFSYSTDPGTTAFVLNIPSMDSLKIRDNLSSQLARFGRAMVSSSKVDAVISCSELSSAPLDVSELFTQAKSIHDYQLITNRNGILFHDDLPSPRGQTTLFNLNDEQQLKRSIMGGNIRAAEEILEDIYNSVEEPSHLDSQSLLLLLEQLKAAVLRIGGEPLFRDSTMADNLHKSLDSLSGLTGFGERFNALKSILVSMAKTVDSHRQSKDERLYKDMLVHIENNFHDPQLGLFELAEKFHLSTGYLSRYFKDHGGLSVSDYIEEKRINRAVELLRNYDLTINDISAAVGYASTNTFYKAFRRIKGMSAGQYRREKT